MTLLDQPVIDAPPRKKRSDDDDLLLFWIEHTPTNIHGLLNGNGWTWNPATQDYTSDYGTRLKQSDIKHIALGFTKSIEETLRADAKDVADGDISPDQWRRKSEADISDEMYLLAALASGGIDQIKSEDEVAIQGVSSTDEVLGHGMADTIDRLKNLAQQIAEGQAGTPKQIIARAGSYATAGYPVYQRVRIYSHNRARDNNGRLLFLYYRNLLAIEAQHCRDTPYSEGCPSVTRAGWKRIGALPEIGTRTCGPNCRCEWEFILVPDFINQERLDEILDRATMGHGIGLSADSVLRLSFDPDQPRDAKGRWASGGLGGGVVVVAGDELGNAKTDDEIRDAAKQHAMDNLRDKYYVNKDTGQPILISKRGIKKILSNSADIRQARMVPKIPEMIAEGQIKGSFAPENPDEQTIAYHRFEVPVNIDGKTETTNFVVQQRRNGSWYYNHAFGNILGKPK